MKVFQLRSLALLVCLSLAPGCAIGNTKYVTSHKATMTEGSEMELGGMNGRITIKNSGPGMVEVKRTRKNGDVLEIVELQAGTDCMMTIRAMDRLTIYNPSGAKTTVETMTVD